MKKYLLTFIFGLIAFVGMSQQMNISGRLEEDTISHKGLKNAVIYLVNVEDSSIVGRQVTGDDGKFSVKEPLGSYQMFINHPKYNGREFYFLATPDNHDFDLGEFYLPAKSTQLDEITIYAYKNPVYYKGDTLVYVADSFKTQPNAVVEDMLKRLPGVEVDKDGKIKVQGKAVDRVLVDGDEFFGSDPTMATRNLSAKSIENVKVYERENEDAGAGDDKMQVMDLTLKDDAKKGYFGKVDGSIGANPEYFQKKPNGKAFFEGEALFNYFTPKIKLSAYALTSNTTKSSLSWQDANKFGIELSNTRTYDEETDSWEKNASVVSDEGYPLMLKTGIFYDQKVNKKLRLGANYTYTNYQVQKQEDRFSQYFLQDTVYYQNYHSESKLKNQNHEMNLRIKWDIDSSQSLEILPKFTFFQTSQNAKIGQNYLSAERDTTRLGTNNNDYDQSGLNAKAKITYLKKFAKKNRKLTLVDNVTYDQFKNATDLFYEDELPSYNIPLGPIIDQLKNENRTITSNLLVAKYQEPFGKRWALEISYENFNIKNNRSFRSFDNDGHGNYNDLDSLYSNDFQSLKFQNIGGLAGIYHYKKINLSFGAKVRNVIYDDKDYFNNAIIHRNLTNVLPFTKLTVKFNDATKLEWTNRTISTLPTINQLQPVRDNSNPNAIQLGNADLLPSYAVNSTLNFSTYKPLSGMWIYGYAQSRYTKNDFAQDVFYDSIGRSVSTYRNIDMFNYVNLFAGAGISIYKKILFLRPGVQFMFNNTYNFVNHELVKNTGLTPGGQLGLMFDNDTIYAELTFSYQNNRVHNLLNAASNQVNDIYKLSFDFSYNLPWKLVLKTDFEYYVMRGMSAGFNTNYFLWNASIGKKFFKKDQLRLDFIVNDILNQNKNIHRMSSINVITDVRKLIITRYFMFKVTYQFNSSPISKPEQDEHF